MMAAAAIQASAADYPYKYLVFTSSDGSTTSVSTDGLTLTAADGNLVAANSEGSTTLPLASLSKMAFAESSDDTGLDADVNGDGAVDVADISSIITVMAGDTQQVESADVNGDGTVDVADISYVITVMAVSLAKIGFPATTESTETDTSAQTLNVEEGQVTWQIPAGQAGDMVFDSGETLTILERTFTISELARMYVDDSEVTDNTVTVAYGGETASVAVAGNIARYMTIDTKGAHVSAAQSADVAEEITYSLSGSTSDGEFYMSGSYKATVELRGLTLTNATPVYSGAAICIMDGKRVSLSAKNGTANTITDASTGSQKAALYCKGHLELKGKGTLNVYGTLAHAIKSAEYMSLKNATVNVLQAVKDGISCDEYFLMESGELTVSGTGDDAMQCDIDGTESTGETTDHEDEDSGNIYINGGTVTLTVTADAAKGVKAGGDFKMSGGTLNVTQTGGVTAVGDLSYPTSIKTDGDIDVSGGTVTIVNTADGGKGMSAEGNVTISGDDTVVNVTANGKGGTATVTPDESSSDTSGQTEQTSYVVYVSLPTSGGGGQGGPGGQGSNAWTTLYLYKSNGTLVQQLTSTVTKTVGSTTTTFYKYDFGASDSGTYYFKSSDYTSRGWGGGTYTIKSETFNGPTSGSDYYYSITNSYTTSGSTRTYKISNVTTTYGGSGSDTADDGTDSYNAMGVKADGNLTISGGTVTVKNSGAMSKSLKSKATLTVSGGTVTLTPSGAMQVTGGDASYSSGVKAADFVQDGGSVVINASGTAGKGVSATNITTTGGTLKITNSGAAQAASTGDYYTAKGMKADGYMKLLGGTVTVTMSGNGGKGIKVNGTYTQGESGGEGPTLTVSTTGSAAGSGSSGGWGGGGMGDNLSGTPKGIKVMGAVYVYGGTSEVSTKNNGGEGLESKTAIYIEGGRHYYACYDDCINSSGKIFFNGGYTVCYSNGNDAVDSNAGTTGAITIGNGAVLAYTSKGSPEEGLDCDNNSYIQITGTGYAISAGASQGGGGGWGGSGNTISNAKQGYYFSTSSLSYTTGRYYTIADASGNNLVTYSLAASLSSTLSLFTAKGMVKGSSYTVKYSTTAPTDADVAWHGLYIGSSHKGTTQLTSFTAI